MRGLPTTLRAAATGDKGAKQTREQGQVCTHVVHAAQQGLVDAAQLLHRL